MIKEDSQRINYRTQLQYSELNKALNHLSSAHVTNIEAQEIYLDIAKKKKKNINSHEIKSIYRMFSENKACEICFEKQSDTDIIHFDQKMIVRYYSRIIEIGIKKISYFWQNSSRLEFLLPGMITFVTKIYDIIHEIYSLKTLQHHRKILRHLFAENSVIEDKIFKLLIQDGFLASMDQFYRINGIDMMTDQNYDRKQKLETQVIEEQDEEDDNVSSLGTAVYLRAPGKSFGQKKKKSHKSLESEIKIEEKNQGRKLMDIESDKKTIKTMFESIIKTLKQIVVDVKNQAEVEAMDLKVNENKVKSSVSSPHNKEAMTLHKKVSKKQNSVETQIRKLPKKLSIQMMSYFSNEFKTLIEQNQPQINYLSQLIVTSESNKSKKIMKPIISLNQQNNLQPKIHSSQSLNIAKHQSRRGKMIDRVTHNKYNQQLDDFFNQERHQTQFEKMKRKIKKPKFSFKSAPGMCISLSNNPTNTKQENGNRQMQRIVFQQNLHYNKKLFENELLTSQFLNQQTNDTPQQLNIIKNDYGLGFGINKQFINQRVQQKEHFRIRSIKTQNSCYQKSSFNNQLTMNRIQQGKICKTMKLECFKGPETQKGQQLSKFSSNKDKQVNKFFTRKSSPQLHRSKNSPLYTIYDRNRRKIMPRF